MVKHLLIGIVGPCAAGKTTLIAALHQNGFEARHIAQEHSYVADMWKRLTNPDILIYLDVSYSNTIKRRNLSWTVDEYDTQVLRLIHARQNADLYLNTDNLAPEMVLDNVLEYLNHRTKHNQSLKGYK